MFLKTDVEKNEENVNSTDLINETPETAPFLFEGLSFIIF